jgi:hypothetical protein
MTGSLGYEIVVSSAITDVPVEYIAPLYTFTFFLFGL